VRPEPLAGPVDVDVPHVSTVDSYSMRLVASRTLYDLGAAMGEVPALAGLVAAAPLRANPHDLDDLGVAPGGSVRLRTATASTVVPAVPDSSLPRKVVAADFNVPVGEGTIADLIDIGAPVVEVRMETP
jgi:anaerobic selenocysteine-containing dehydrogenase